MKKLLKFILIIALVWIVGITVLSYFVGVYHKDQVYDAQTEEQIKTACSSEWYQVKPQNELPVKCLDYYKQYE